MLTHKNAVPHRLIFVKNDALTQEVFFDNMYKEEIGTKLQPSRAITYINSNQKLKILSEDFYTHNPQKGLI